MPYYSRSSGGGPGNLLMQAYEQQLRLARERAAQSERSYGQLGQTLNTIPQAIGSGIDTMLNAQVQAAKIGYDDRVRQQQDEMRRQERQAERDAEMARLDKNLDYSRWQDRYRAQELQKRDMNLWAQKEGFQGIDSLRAAAGQADMDPDSFIQLNRQIQAAESSQLSAEVQAKLASGELEAVPDPQGQSKAQELFQQANQEMMAAAEAEQFNPYHAVELRTAAARHTRQGQLYGQMKVLRPKKQEASPVIKPATSPDGQPILGLDGQPEHLLMNPKTGSWETVKRQGSAPSASASAKASPEQHWLDVQIDKQLDSEDKQRTHPPLDGVNPKPPMTLAERVLRRDQIRSDYLNMRALSPMQTLPGVDVAPTATGAPAPAPQPMEPRSYIPAGGFGGTSAPPFDPSAQTTQPAQATQQLPMVTTPKEQRQIGQQYRTPLGQVVIWMGSGWYTPSQWMSLQGQR